MTLRPLLITAMLSLFACDSSIGSAPAPGAAAHSAQRLQLVKMVSWAELAQVGCRIDIEGTSSPARFSLRYREQGAAEQHIDQVQQLAPAGWAMVNRSERGYGFERAGEYRALSMDAVEELRCSCRPTSGAAPWQQNIPIHVQVEWQQGSAPRVRGFMGKDDAVSVEPVRIGGRMALYRFGFEQPTPANVEGRCASGFLAGLQFSRPIEIAGSTPMN